MRTLTAGVLILLLSGCESQAERVVFVGFDLSATAWRGRNNLYDAGWAQILGTVQGGDHVYASVINGRGLANGAPAIDFTIRPYSFLIDRNQKYVPAVKAKLERQREILNNVLKASTPSKRTEIIGFLHAAAQILGAYPSMTVKQVVIWTDGLQEGDEVDLARIVISDEQISKIIETERQAGRLPKLNSISIWFVTSPSIESGQLTTARLLRLEAFWRKYVQACGGEVKAFSPVLVSFGEHVTVGSSLPTSLRSNSRPFNQGESMLVYPDTQELLRLNSAGDRLLLKDLFDGTIITGSKGSGKSSTALRYLLAALLKIGCGGVIPCPKPFTDERDYLALIARFQRSRDVILMRPGPDWHTKPTNALNILDAEQRLFGHGKANVEKVTALLMKVVDFIQRKGGQAQPSGDAAFWKSYAESIIRAGLTVQSVLTNRFDLKLLLKFIGSLPNTVEQTESQSLYSIAQLHEAAAKLGDNPPYEFTSVWDFVHDWPTTPPNSRGSGLLTVKVLLDSLLSHPLRQMFFEETTFEIERLNHGGLIVLAMDVQCYPHGALAGMILKDLTSRWCQARPELSALDPEFVSPIVLCYDEAPFYLIDEDEGHARSARSARLIPIFITQTTTAVKAVFHDKDRAQDLIDLAGNRWAFNNGSSETNTWMADTIGKVIVRRGGGQTGTQTTFGPQNTYGHNRGANYTEQVDYDCPPRVFTRLRRGGPQNNLRAEAIYWRNGDQFCWNDRRWLPVVLPQNFKPGRDEVRVTATARQKGGDDLVRQFTAKLSDFGSAAKARWF